MGVGGADDNNGVIPIEMAAFVERLLSPAVGKGNESHVDVTSRVFSTARRYFPRNL